MARALAAVTALLIACKGSAPSETLSSAAPLDLAAPIPLDPSLHEGALANGLRFDIVQNSTARSGPSCASW